MLVENSNTYTMNAVSREAAGEYKCSLADNEKMEASQTIVVSCKYSSDKLPFNPFHPGAAMMTRKLSFGKFSDGMRAAKRRCGRREATIKS